MQVIATMSRTQGEYPRKKETWKHTPSLPARLKCISLGTVWLWPIGWQENLLRCYWPGMVGRDLPTGVAVRVSGRLPAVVLVKLTEVYATLGCSYQWQSSCLLMNQLGSSLLAAIVYKPEKQKNIGTKVRGPFLLRHSSSAFYSSSTLYQLQERNVYRVQFHYHKTIQRRVDS